MINAIVILTTLFALAFVLVWVLRPSFRTWVEKPKYTMLENEELYRRVFKGNHEG